jgi:hypothetical protein
MIPDISAPLTPGEFQSLRDISKDAMKPVIPNEHRARLLELRYLKEGLGGLMLTDAGQMRLAAGH